MSSETFTLGSETVRWYHCKFISISILIFLDTKSVFSRNIRKYFNPRLGLNPQPSEMR